MIVNGKHIDLVVGARPNYIKASPVYKALSRKEGYQLTLIDTGQHYDESMSKIFVSELGLPDPDICLSVGSGSHGKQTSEIIQRYEEKLFLHPPNLVVVFGDVNSTIGCALAAAKLDIPVAHVEAGLRSYDRKMPEEINRVLTDQLSTLLFTTSRESGSNLVREGISQSNIFFVGNTMIDSLIDMSPHFETAAIRQNKVFNRPYVLITFHRPYTVDSKSNLELIVESLTELANKIHCVFPLHPRTKSRIIEFGCGDQLENNDNITLTEPLGYLDFMCLQKSASAVITDSGGIQEETTYFGIPCLTVRENTERPVTIQEGTNKLIGTSYKNISAEVFRALDLGIRNSVVPEKWDGKSGERIAQVIDHWVHQS